MKSIDLCWVTSRVAWSTDRTDPHFIMAKRARKTKPEPAPAHSEDDFSAVTLRALATERRAREREFVDAHLPKFKADLQSRVRSAARDGRTTFLKGYNLRALADACDRCGYMITEAQCLALGERLTDAVVASWFPGCRGVKVVADEGSIDVCIQL